MDATDEQDALSVYARQYREVYPWADTAAIELWSRLGDAYTAQRAAQDRLYQSFGLERKGGRMAALRALYFAPDHRLTQFEIGSDVKVTSAHVTYLIDSLEKDGLAVRSPHPSDRRMMHVELTPKGVALCERLVPAMARFMGDIAADLSDAEKVLLNRLLAKLRRSAEASMRNEAEAPATQIDR